MSPENEPFVSPSKSNVELCARIDKNLKSLYGTDAFVDFAADNEDILSNAFLARGILNGLIYPSKELLEKISSVEIEIQNLVDEYCQSDSEEDFEEDGQEL